MRTAYLFDFFGVISSEVAPVWIQEKLPQASPKEIHDDLIAPVDEGKSSDEELFRVLGTLSKTPPEGVVREWNGLAHIDREVVALIEELKATHKIGLCSNAWSSFLRPILERENLASLFDSIVISSEIGRMKPDPAMFMASCNALGVTPEECVFIDDQAKNTDAARALGMEAIQFVSVYDLRTQLVRGTA